MNWRAIEVRNELGGLEGVVFMTPSESWSVRCTPCNKVVGERRESALLGLIALQAHVMGAHPSDNPGLGR